MKIQRRATISAILMLFFTFFHTETQAQYAKGCDIGWLTQMEASGRKFYDKNGVQKDLLDILKSYDINSIRLRVWVDPANGYCNKTDVINQAVRCKNKGFRILIDFHYSDSWADPGKQTKPAAWTSYNFTQLKQAVAAHTNDVLTGLKSAGVYPEWVQVGNETNNGMLWEDGKASVNMNNFAQLITSGYDAVKAVFPATKVIVHLSNGYDNALFRWMFDGLKNNSAKWDVIGMSLYPEQGITGQTWQTLDPQCLTNMNDMANRYGKEVVLAEVGISWSDANAAYSFIADIMAKNKSVTGGKGIGIFYWEPQSYYGWQGYHKGAFDDTGKPTHAMDAFLEGASTTNQEPVVSITSPITNSTFSTASTITIDVNASDPNGSISKVELYANGGTRLGSDVSSPYSFTWTGAAAGSYVLTAIAYDNSGQIKISSGVNLTLVTGCVTPSAPAVTSSVIYCQGAPATALTANGTSLKWYTSPTTGTGTSTAPIPSTTSAGIQNYYVSQTLNACESSRTLITVTVNAIPSAPAVTSPVNYCQGAPATAVAATGTSLKWYTAPTTGIGSSTAPIPSTTSAGTQNYYVSQTANGCESSRNLITITVDAKPSSASVGANQNITSSSATLAANTPAIGIGTWTRIGGTGTISDIHNPAAMVSGLSQGSNSFRWTISNGSCPVSSSDVFIVVGNAPVTQIITGPDSIGLGSIVSFSIPAHVGSSYSWTIPTGATIQSGQNSNSIQVVFSSSVIAEIIAVVETNAYGSATSQKNVWSGPAPSIFDIDGPTTVTEGASGYTFSVPVIPKTIYNWIVPQGAMILSGQGSNTITVAFPPGTNSGALGVTATNAFGSSVRSIPVTVSTITTNTSSMTKYTHVTVAPNPFVDETRIDFHYKKNAGSAILKVMNIQGEIVYEATEFDINETISIGKELKSGIYIVVVIYENQSYVRTVVKNQ